MTNEFLRVDHYQWMFDSLIHVDPFFCTKYLGEHIDWYHEHKYWDIFEELEESFGQHSLFFAMYDIVLPHVLIASKPMSLEESNLLESLTKRCQKPMGELLNPYCCFVHFTDYKQALGLEAILQTTLISSCRLFCDC